MKRSGFTLLELLCVVAIILTVAGISASVLSKSKWNIKDRIRRIYATHDVRLQIVLQDPMEGRTPSERIRLEALYDLWIGSPNPDR